VAQRGRRILPRDADPKAGPAPDIPMTAWDAWVRDEGMLGLTLTLLGSAGP